VTPPPGVLALLALTAFVAGVVDAVAGGGGLFTVPALLAVGLPPSVALATNKGQSVWGSGAATIAFWRAGKIDRAQARFAFPLALLGATTSTARAQAAASDTATLTPVVVTATRLPSAVGAATLSTTVISGDDLRARGVTTVLEALRETPSVAVVQGGSFGQQTSVFMRGGQSNYTQVLIDGVVVNDPGGAIDFANLTTDNIDRIEIVRGPASVLYGANAVTGVIQIFTRRGRGAPQVRIRAHDWHAARRRSLRP